jgi:hypothetical protein
MISVPEKKCRCGAEMAVELLEPHTYGTCWITYKCTCGDTSTIFHEEKDKEDDGE